MQIRGKGNAFAVAIGNWAVSTLWNQVSPIALDQIHWKFYFIFVAWSKLSPRPPKMAQEADPLIFLCRPVRFFPRDIFLVPRDQAEDAGGNRPIVWTAHARANTRRGSADGEG